MKFPGTKLFKDIKWLGWVHYHLSSFLKEVNSLNVSMQEKSGDILLFNGKTTSMKEKLITWTENVKTFHALKSF